jgi:hypothetical protein
MKMLGISWNCKNVALKATPRCLSAPLPCKKGPYPGGSTASQPRWGPGTHAMTDQATPTHVVRPHGVQSLAACNQPNRWRQRVCTRAPTKAHYTANVMVTARACAAAMAGQGTRQGRARPPKLPELTATCVICVMLAVPVIRQHSDRQCGLGQSTPIIQAQHHAQPCDQHCKH